MDRCEQTGAERPGGRIAPNELSEVRRTVAVLSGKGGVGKSTVTALLAVLARRMGLRVGVLDVDLTGPSIPRLLGVQGRVEEGPDGLFPRRSATGIEVMSAGLLLQAEDAPLILRGAVLSGTVRQLFERTLWDELDLLLVDCPPGTGDIPLTVLTELPVDTAVAVSVPQSLACLAVEKSLQAVQRAGVRLAGLVENMSGFLCPECGGVHALLGESRAAALAEKYGIPQVARLPLTVKLAAAADAGMTELFEGDWLDALAESLMGDLL